MHGSSCWPARDEVKGDELSGPKRRLWHTPKVITATSELTQHSIYTGTDGTPVSGAS